MNYQPRIGEDGVSEILISGQLTFTDLDRFRTMFQLVEYSTAKYWRLDLSKVETIDSSALGILLLMQDDLKSRQVALDIVTTNPRLQQIRLLDATNGIWLKASP